VGGEAEGTNNINPTLAPPQGVLLEATESDPVQVDDLLSELCREALHRSTGEFTVDHSQLVSRYTTMVEHQPGLALLRTLQLGVQLGAYQVNIILGRNDFQVRLDNVAKVDEVLTFLRHFPGRGPLHQDIGAICYLLLAQDQAGEIELRIGDGLGHQRLEMTRQAQRFFHQGEFAEGHLTLSWRPRWNGRWDRFRRAHHWISSRTRAVRHYAAIYPLPVSLDALMMTPALDGELMPPKAPQLHYQPARTRQESLALYHPIHWQPRLLTLPWATYTLDGKGLHCYLCETPEVGQRFGPRPLNARQSGGYDTMPDELILGKNQAEDRLWVVAAPKHWLLNCRPLNFQSPLRPFACRCCLAEVKRGNGGWVLPVRHGVLLDRQKTNELPDHLVALASMPEELKTDLSGTRPVLSPEWSEWVRQLACLSDKR